MIRISKELHQEFLKVQLHQYYFSLKSSPKQMTVANKNKPDIPLNIPSVFNTLYWLRFTVPENEVAYAIHNFQRTSLLRKYQTFTCIHFSFNSQFPLAFPTNSDPIRRNTSFWENKQTNNPIEPNSKKKSNQTCSSQMLASTDSSWFPYRNKEWRADSFPHFHATDDFVVIHHSLFSCPFPRMKCCNFEVVFQEAIPYIL